jgi:Acyl-CoA dehydrogenase, N-terminal domain/Acyl-CoA dehydrogenase, middle domain
MSRGTPEFVAALREVLARESPSERVRELDERHEPPLELLRRLGELGYLSVGLPAGYDGHGDAYDVVRLMEEVGYHSLPLGHLAGRSIYAMALLLEFGTRAQRERWIPALRSGEIVYSIGMTEPDAGSDAAAVKTRAIADGAHYVINGEKVYSSSMGYAGLAMVSTRTKAGSSGREGLTTPPTSAATHVPLSPVTDSISGSSASFWSLTERAMTGEQRCGIPVPRRGLAGGTYAVKPDGTGSGSCPRAGAAGHGAASGRAARAFPRPSAPPVPPATHVRLFTRYGHLFRLWHLFRDGLDDHEAFCPRNGGTTLRDHQACCRCD